MNATLVSRTTAVVALALFLAFSVACSLVSSTDTPESPLTPEPPEALAQKAKDFLRAIWDDDFEKAKALICPEKESSLKTLFEDSWIKEAIDLEGALESCRFEKHKHIYDYDVNCSLGKWTSAGEIYSEEYIFVFQIERNTICEWTKLTIERNIMIEH